MDSFPDFHLAVFHQGVAQNGELWYARHGSTGDWWPDGQVPIDGMVESPSPVEYPQGKLYIFYLQVATLLSYSVFDGERWDRNIVPDVDARNSPSALVWNRNVHVFYQAGHLVAPNANLGYRYMDSAGNWSSEQAVPGAELWESPSAVRFGPDYPDDLYIFYQNQAGGGQGQLFYARWSSAVKTWLAPVQVQNVGMSDSPSAVVFRGHLYVFHQGAYQNGELWYSVFDGNTWAADKRIDLGVRLVAKSPGAVVWNQAIHVFYQGEAPPISAHRRISGTGH